MKNQKKKRIKLKSGKEYKKDSELCLPCFNRLWNELLYIYRVSIQGFLPKEVRERPNCWYGNECRTQIHKQDHAKKYNHICDKRADH